jgi:hypothetical protein
MKWHSVLDSLFQSARLAERLNSTAVQKEALAFIYICQMLAWCMGRVQNNVGSSVVAVWGQGVFHFWCSCVLMIARAGWEPGRLSLQHGLCWCRIHSSYCHCCG